IREKRGLAYSPYCSASPSMAYKGTGYIGAVLQTDPEKAATAATIASDLMQTFMKDGPTEAELDAVRKQFKNSLDTQLKEPGYWVRVLNDLDYRGTKLSDVKEVAEKFGSYTRDDIMEVLKRYMTSERQIQVIATPKKPEAGTAEHK